MSTPAASTPVTGVWQPGRRLLTAGLILTVTLVAAEALAVGTVMPLVEDELGDLWLYGWVFSAFFLGNLVGIVVAGRAADRMHPARPFAAGLVLFAVGLVLGGLAPSMPALVAARLLQGLGAGALPATAYVCIARGYPPPLRPRMFALLSTAWVVPGLVGPALAALVGETVGWRWVFLGLLPLVGVGGAAAVRAIARTIPPSAPGTSEAAGTSEPRRTLRDAVLVAVAAALFLAGLSVEPLVLGAVLAAVSAVGGLAVYRRLVPPGTLRAAPGLPVTVLLRGLLTCSFFAANAFVPLAITDVRGASTAVVGAALMAATIGWTTGAWIQERMVYRVGPRLLVVLGFVGLVGSLALAALALRDQTPMALTVVAWAVAGLAMGPAYASISVTVLAEADPGTEGAATAALQLTDVLGIALGAGVAGAIVAIGDDLGAALGGSIAAVYVFAAVVASGGAVLGRRLRARLPEVVPTEGASRS